MNIKGKNIIITGGSLGIGKATALKLINEGANVLVTGRSYERLSNVFKNDEAKLISFDIGDLDNISHNANKCLEIMEGKIDVLINNAGIGVSSSLEALTKMIF